MTSNPKGVRAAAEAGYAGHRASPEDVDNEVRHLESCLERSPGWYPLYAASARTQSAPIQHEHQPEEKAPSGMTSPSPPPPVPLEGMYFNVT